MNRYDETTAQTYDLSGSVSVDVSMNNVPFPPYDPYQPWNPAPPYPYSPPWVPPYPYSPPPPPYINPNPFGVSPVIWYPPPQEYVPIHPPKPSFGRVTIVVVDEHGCVSTEMMYVEEWKKLREKKDDSTT